MIATGSLVVGEDLVVTEKGRVLIDVTFIAKEMDHRAGLWVAETSVGPWHGFGDTELEAIVNAQADMLSQLGAARSSFERTS